MSAETTTENFAVRAGKIIPEAGSAAIEDGLLVVRQGKVHALGPFAEIASDALAQEPELTVQDRSDAILVPGLINAHTHLELSHMRGRTRSGAGFTAWVESMLTGGLDDVSFDAICLAAQELAACGTALVVDITSREPGLVAKALDSAGINAVLAAEYFGYSSTQEEFSRGILPGNAQQVCQSREKKQKEQQSQVPVQKTFQEVVLAGHALYSTPANILQQAKACNEKRGALYPLHLAEHEQETQMLVHGTGEFFELLRQGVIPEDYTPPKMRPVPYADSLGLLNERTLAVHCVQVTQEDREILKQRNVAVCLCPRSNEFIAVGRAPWEQFCEAGLRICLGTDGLSSNTDLNLWNEAAFILENSRTLDFATVLSWMTTVPAQIAGVRENFGTLRPGMQACYSTVPDALHAYIC